MFTKLLFTFESKSTVSISLFPFGVRDVKDHIATVSSSPKKKRAENGGERVCAIEYIRRKRKEKRGRERKKRVGVCERELERKRQRESYKSQRKHGRLARN